MSEIMDVTLPDIGEFTDVEIIEITVAPGDEIAVDDVLVVIESDKASMDIPSPAAGIVTNINISLGDRVVTGDVLAQLTVQPTTGAHAPSERAQQPRSEPDPVVDDALEFVSANNAFDHAEPDVDLVVLGSGPGGYAAAFRAADLGLKTALVERYSTLGGVCLNVGCIPSKAYLHMAQVLEDAKALKAHGISFDAPRIELAKLRGFKATVVGRITKGLAGLAKRRKVRIVRGQGAFLDANRVSITHSGAKEIISFRHAIIAVGSQPASLPGIPEDPRIIDSTDALELDGIPSRLLIIGAGIIGLEMATVYAALGSRVTIVELLDKLMPGCDQDLVRPLKDRLDSRLEAIHLNTKVTQLRLQKHRVKAEFQGPNAPKSALFDKVLIAIGRRPNGATLGCEKAGIHVDEHGYIPVDKQQRTNVSHIFAVGDVCGTPMLAHKASHEGKTAAEVVAGHRSRFDALGIPSVAYTDPEVAWVGLTEEEAEARSEAFDKVVFPWTASGRALGMDRSEGLTKLLFDPQNNRLIGAGIVGRHAGDLIAEATLALELGADAEDLALTVHPHPTLGETVNLSAEMMTGAITDLYVPRAKDK